MGAGLLGVVYHLGTRIGDETEAPASFCGGILHHHYVDDFAPLFKVLLQRFIGCMVVQASNEKFAELLRLQTILDLFI